MSELTERGAVRAEFYHRAPRGEARTLEALRVLVIDGMADEIVRQRQRADRAERILAALREPSEAALDAAYEAYKWWDNSLGPSIRAAVAAAEREAGA